MTTMEARGAKSDREGRCRDWSQRVAAGVAGVVTAASLVLAQNTPDFSGTWEVNKDKTAASGPTTGPRGGMARGSTPGGRVATATASGQPAAAPQPWVLTQTETALTIVRDLGDGSTRKWVYRLDRSESVNTVGRTTTTTRSRWDGGKLVTEGRQVIRTEQGDVSGTFKETRWLDKEGAMHVETTRALEGRAPGTTYLVLEKKKP
jgi:hypothetical protein